jgi:hypothetical protein
MNSGVEGAKKFLSIENRQKFFSPNDEFSEPP